MPAVHYELSINDDNKPVDDIVYSNIMHLEVEDSDTNADSFLIRLSATRLSTGRWSFPAKDDFQLFKKVRISASFPNNRSAEHLIEGYITHIDFHIDKDETKSYVDISGMDATVLMNLQEKLVAWEDKSDSEIAKEIFSNYGFDTDIEDTLTPQYEPSFTVIQRETDIEFLKRLALRNGFDCYIKTDYDKNKTTGYFRKRKLELEPQKDLAVQFGPNNNVVSMDFSIDALRPLSVEIRQKDAFTEETREITIEDSKLPKIGAQNLQELIAPNIGAAASGEILIPKMVLSRHVTSELHIMETLARSVFDDGSWFITARGTVNAEVYGYVLKAKNMVLIKGTDDNFSGKYYITKVVHKFKPESYLQEFEAKKNAIGLDGSERFENLRKSTSL